MASTYPGVIPYRSHSPSQREYADNQVPQLIKVSNPNFSLKRPPSLASASRHPQNEEELREQYYEYWLQQVSKSVKVKTIVRLKGVINTVLLEETRFNCYFRSLINCEFGRTKSFRVPRLVTNTNNTVSYAFINAQY